MQNNRRADTFLYDYFAVVKAQQNLTAVFYLQLEVLLGRSSSGTLPGPRIPAGVEFTDRENLTHYQKTAQALQELYGYSAEYYAALLFRYQHGVNSHVSAATAKGNAALMQIIQSDL